MLRHARVPLRVRHDERRLRIDHELAKGNASTRGARNRKRFRQTNGRSKNLRALENERHRGRRNTKRRRNLDHRALKLGVVNRRHLGRAGGRHDTPPKLVNHMCESFSRFARPRQDFQGRMSGENRIHFADLQIMCPVAEREAPQRS